MLFFYHNHKQRTHSVDKFLRQAETKIIDVWPFCKADFFSEKDNFFTQNDNYFQSFSEKFTFCEFSKRSHISDSNMYCEFKHARKEYFVIKSLNYDFLLSGS